MERKFNETSLETLCAALAYAMGIDAPEQAAAADTRLTDYVDRVLDGKKVDRLVMYNPDAIAQYIHEKYSHLMAEVKSRTEIELPYSCMMPSVTPVCFGTMYTGAKPEVHGIQAYEKPIIRIDTLFDAAISTGKRIALIAEKDCSMAEIFKEREMDYFIYDTDEEINAKATELIVKDEYDFLLIYNGNYDTVMHKYGPESVEALSELRCDVHAYAMFDSLIRTHWKHHNTLVGFAMDHGAHVIDGGCGSHGLYMPEDINIVHMYKVYRGESM